MSLSSPVIFVPEASFYLQALVDALPDAVMILDECHEVLLTAGDRTVVSGAQARKGWRRTGVCSLQMRIRRRGP
jgi:hypothetical protein